MKKPDSSPLLLLLYLCGLNGLIMAANELLMLSSFFFFLTAAAASGASIFLWYIYIYRTKLFSPIIIAGCIAAVTYSLLNYRNILDTISGANQEKASIPLSSSIIIAAVLLLLVFTMEFVSRNHSIMFLLCAAVIIFGSSAGIQLSVLSTVLIIIFQFGFLVLNMAQAPRRKRLIMESRAHISALCSIIAAVFIIICFLPSFVFTDTFEDELYSQVYMADAAVQELSKTLSEMTSSDIIDGQVNRGNLHQTGREIFKINSVYPLNDRLYLKGFTGQNYFEQAWDSAYLDLYDSDVFTKPTVTSYLNDLPDDYSGIYTNSNSRNNMIHFYREPFMNELVEKVKNDYFFDAEKTFSDSTGYTLNKPLAVTDSGLTSNSLVGLSFYDVTIQYDGHISLTSPVSGDFRSIDCKVIPPFPELILDKNTSDVVQTVFARDISYDTISKEEGNMINIEPVENSIQNVLIPYNSKYSVNELTSFNNQISMPYSNIYKYSPETKSSATSVAYASSEHSYDSFLEAYGKETEEQYTLTPYENMPRLTDLCSETELTELNDITTFILYTLQTHASYSTTPGTVPYNKDTIEYFLFENHKGYCVHYATTAVMMYRLYGIPARYATGYVISPENIHLIDGVDTSAPQGTADYRFTGTITDKSAHAWVEIFLKDYGWVPVEVTPTASNEMIASYPGYDPIEMQRIMDKYGWKFTGLTGDRNANRNILGGDDDGITLLQLSIILLILSAVGAVVFIILRRLYILNKQKTMSCPDIYDRLITALHSSDLLKSINGSEDYFPEVLAEAVPVLSAEDCAGIVETLRYYHYSGEEVSPEDEEKVRGLYSTASKYLYEHTAWYKKPYFRFIKALC